jgi:hypothetical protein
MPGFDTLALHDKLGHTPQTDEAWALEREIWVALLGSPHRFQFASLDSLTSHIRVRRNMALDARKTALAFKTEAAERPQAFWQDGGDEAGFILQPGRCLVEALTAATQPDATGKLYDFSCYRATEYVILLGIAQELKSENPELLAQLQSLNQVHAVRSGQFHEVYLVEYGSMEAPLPDVFMCRATACGFATPMSAPPTSRATRALGSSTWAAACSATSGSATRPTPSSPKPSKFSTGKTAPTPTPKAPCRWTSRWWRRGSPNRGQPFSTHPGFGAHAAHARPQRRLRRRRLHRHHPRIPQKREPRALRVGAAQLLKTRRHSAHLITQGVGRQTVDFTQQLRQRPARGVQQSLAFFQRLRPRHCPPHRGGCSPAFASPVWRFCRCPKFQNPQRGLATLERKFCAKSMRTRSGRSASIIDVSVSPACTPNRCSSGGNSAFTSPPCASRSGKLNQLTL